MTLCYVDVLCSLGGGHPLRTPDPIKEQFLYYIRLLKANSLFAYSMLCECFT
jgi:hypothetical protein